MSFQTILDPKPTNRLNRAGLPILGRQQNGKFEGVWFIGVDEDGRLVFMNARGRFRKDTFASADRY